MKKEISNLVLLTGPNDFQLNKKLKFYKTKFREKFPNGEISFLSKDETFLDLENSVFTPNLFGGKRLIISANFWDSEKYDQAKKKKFFDNLPNYTDDCTLIISEPKIDKRTKFCKFLLKNARTENFEELDEKELIVWVIKTASKNNSSISKENAKFLLERCGSNLWKLENEIKKISTQGEEISREIINNETIASPEVEIWDFLNYLSRQKAVSAIGKFRDLLIKGTSVQEIFSMVQREIRIHAQLRAGLDKNLSEREIVDATKLHPFVVKKTLPLTRQFPAKKIEKLYDALFEIDLKVKTGGFYITTSDSSELETALEKFIIKLCA